jgi:hypothetical protein
MTSNVSFVDDPLSRRVIRLLFLLQIAALVIVMGLSLAHLFFLALFLSVLTLLLLGITLLWLYARYRELPVIREKRALERLASKFSKGVQTEEKNIQAAVRERAHLVQAEKQEINTALGTLQKKHIENGLQMASIHEADISGVGPELKERLRGYDILNAADITEKITALREIGEAERQALLDWRVSVLEQLESTQPSELPQKQLEAIQEKSHALQGQNNANERKARASKQMLEYELISFRERLRQLAAFTFSRYLSRSLASRRVVAAPLAFALIIAPVLSSLGATTLSIVASTPAPITSPTETMRPARKATNTVTHPQLATAAPVETETKSPVQTSTFTATSLPTETRTSILTATTTQTSTATHTPFPILTLQPSDTAIIPVSGGGNTAGCDPAYPGVCIPPAPPDLDCKDVPYRRFQVLAPDPHNFDRDDDGIGCES